MRIRQFTVTITKTSKMTNKEDSERRCEGVPTSLKDYMDVTKNKLMVLVLVCGELVGPTLKHTPRPPQACASVLFRHSVSLSSSFSSTLFHPRAASLPYMSRPSPWLPGSEC